MLRVDLLLPFWPSWTSAAIGAAWALLLLLGIGTLVSRLARQGWRVGDTRKVFHFSVFTGVSLLRWQVDTGAVVVFGCCVFAWVVWATLRGPKSGLYLAMARPSDAPQEKLHILAPLVGTAAGGVIGQLIAGNLAVVGYLVAGWGDAVGEPVGIRWGRHRYRVPAFGIPMAERSLEGSLAVFVASGLAAATALTFLGQETSAVISSSLLIAAAATLIEAASPHGWDNFTLLVGIAWLARVCSG